MTDIDYGPRNPQAMKLATTAMYAAIHGDDTKAIAAVQAISDETGSDGMMDAILGWCDTMIAYQPGIEPGKAVNVAWMEVNSNEVNTDPSKVPPTVAWAAHLIAARVADDHDAFDDLMQSVPTEPTTAMGDHIWALLQMVSVNLREVVEARDTVRGTASK